MKHKQRVFIGSSKEALPLANRAKKVLEKNFDVVVWNEVFKINKNFLDDLMKATLLFDFALLIGTSDDKVTFRGDKVKQPRDNIIFELGLFFGRVGTAKCTILVEDKIKIPSDLLGITLQYFNKKEKKSFDDAVKNINGFFKEGNYPEINFFPSTTLAGVYYQNFILPVREHIWKEKGITVDGKLYPYSSIEINVIIPEEINADVNRQFEKLKQGKSYLPLNIQYDGRPRTFSMEIKNDRLFIIDFPTVIAGINNAIQLLLPHAFNNLNDEYNLVLQREVDHFCKALTLKLKKEGDKGLVKFIPVNEKTFSNK